VFVKLRFSRAGTEFTAHLLPQTCVFKNTLPLDKQREYGPISLISPGVALSHDLTYRPDFTSVQ